MLRAARERAGLSIRDLARLAGTSHSAVVAYESGAREPRLDTFERLLRATGMRVRVEAGPEARVDVGRNGRLLAEVLALADALPQRRPERRLRFPRFPR